MRRVITLITVGIVAMTASIASAQYSVTYQGRLADGGNSIDGNFEMFFIIFDAPTGGVSLDFVNLPDVPVVDGYFTVDLDFATPQLFVSQDRWLEIRVRPLGGVQTILEPRQPVMAVPRALTADYAVTGVTAGSGLTGGGGPGAVTVSLDPAVTQLIADLETLVTSQTAVITALETQVANLQAEVDGFSSDLADLQGRVSTVEDVTTPMTLTTIDGYPSIVVEGVNIHLRNGLGGTNTDNGLGNLVLGYNESRADPADNIRTGSHIVVTGREQNYEGSAGFLGGYQNTLNADYGSILSGFSNENYGLGSAVVGGLFNIAGHPNDPNESFYSVVVSGYNNLGLGRGAGILAGQNNVTRGLYSAIVSGTSNQTSGTRSCIVSGFSNVANGRNSVIVGGGISTTGVFGDTGLGNAAVVVGGYRNESEGTYAVTVGGFVNKSSDAYTVVSSGFNREAASEGLWISSSFSDSDFD